MTRIFHSVLLFSILILFFLLTIPPAHADCTGPGCSCSINVPDFTFNAYDTNNKSSADASSTVSVTCSALATGSNIAYDISISKGNSGTYSERELMSGVSTLAYNLFTNSARSVVWGDGSGMSTSVSAAYTLSSLSRTDHFDIFGRIPAEQNVPVGQYTDILTVTIAF